MKVPSENNPDNELFTFFPRETRDKKRITEILDTLYTSNVPSRNLYEGERLTALGKEVAKILAIKATEFPFIRIFHYYKRRKERREYIEHFYQLDDPHVYPSADADSTRNKYKDVWNDDNFFVLFENQRSEVAATCKIVTCPECKGSGKEYYTGESQTDIEMTCPRCHGSGKEGIYPCERCKGKGHVPGIRTTRERRSRSCRKCDGKGEVKSTLWASLETEVGFADSLDSLSKKNDIRNGAFSEIKWSTILQHEPMLSAELRGRDFSWSRLKDDESKNAARIKTIKKIVVKGGVIDPSKNDLSQLPLAREEDIKRVFDKCYPEKDDYDYARSAIFKQNDTSNPNVHTTCSDEEIRIVTGIGWVRVELNAEQYDNQPNEIWVNTLTKEVKNIPWLYKREVIYPNERPDPSLHKAIKEARKEIRKNPIVRKKRIKFLCDIGCRLLAASMVGFSLWWWLEGLTIEALSGMFEQVKGMTTTGVPTNLFLSVIISCGMAVLLITCKFLQVQRAKIILGILWRIPLSMAVGFLFWWWFEGFNKEALPGMLEQVKGIRGGISKNLSLAMMVSGGSFVAWYLLTFILSKVSISFEGVVQVLSSLIACVPAAVLITSGHWGVGGWMALAIVCAISAKFEDKAHDSWWRWILMSIGLWVSGGFGMNGSWIISSVVTAFSMGILLKDEK